MEATVIIIGSADIIKLGLVRSLGVKECKVIVIQLTNNTKYHIRKPLDYYSKYVSEYHFVRENNLICFLLEKYADEMNRPVLFALDDTSVYLLDKEYSRLNRFFYLSNINHQPEGIVRLMNKYVQKQFASNAGINTPKGWIIEYTDGDYKIPNDIEYPCFVKSLLCYYGAKGLQSRCDNKNDLTLFLKKSAIASQIPLIAEEFIPIEKEVGIIGLCFDGRCIVPAKLTKTESETGKGTVNGVTMIGNILPMNDNDIDFVPLQKFLTSLNYTGIINLDFIESKGKLYFLEANFRYAAYGYGLALADVNLPALYVDMIQGRNKDVSLTGVKRFFNEKIAAKTIIEGFLSWKQYRSMKNEADFCAIESKEDPVPYRHFIIRYTLSYINSRIMKCLSHR